MEAYIYDAIRTVRGKGNKKGALMGITPTELVTQVLIELRNRHDLDTTQVEDLVLGCVGQVMDQAANIAKSAAQASGYGDHLCGVTLNRFCGSGLESINQAAAYVKSGYRNMMIAGGVESMSRVKVGSDGGGMFIDPVLAIPGNIVPQGISADLIATRDGFSRNDVDIFAAESQKRASAAQKALPQAGSGGGEAGAIRRSRANAGECRVPVVLWRQGDRSVRLLLSVSALADESRGADLSQVAGSSLQRLRIG